MISIGLTYSTDLLYEFFYRQNFKYIDCNSKFDFKITGFLSSFFSLEQIWYVVQLSIITRIRFQSQLPSFFLENVSVGNTRSSLYTVHIFAYFTGNMGIMFRNCIKKIQILKLHEIWLIPIKNTIYHYNPLWQYTLFIFWFN